MKFYVDSVPCFEGDMDFTGAQVENGGVQHSPDAIDCQRKCQETEPCQYWSWTTPDFTGYENQYHLKQEKGESVPKLNVISGPKDCTIGSSNCYAVDIEYNVEEVNILETLSISSTSDCQSECDDNDDCFYWTYFPDTDQCQLKRTHGQVYTAFGAISGPKTCPGPTDSEIFFDSYTKSKAFLFSSQEAIEEELDRELSECGGGALNTVKVMGQIGSTVVQSTLGSTALGLGVIVLAQLTGSKDDCYWDAMKQFVIDMIDEKIASNDIDDFYRQMDGWRLELDTIDEREDDLSEKYFDNLEEVELDIINKQPLITGDDIKSKATILARDYLNLRIGISVEVLQNSWTSDPNVNIEQLLRAMSEIRTFIDESIDDAVGDLQGRIYSKDILGDREGCNLVFTSDGGAKCVCGSTDFGASHCTEYREYWYVPKDGDDQRFNTEDEAKNFANDHIRNNMAEALADSKENWDKIQAELEDTCDCIVE